jgi:predicted MFS family arabinose efflux permease
VTRRTLLAAAVAVAVAVAFADSSIVVLALPELYARFDTSIEGVAWVITSYNLVLAICALALVLVVHHVRANLLLAAGTVLFLGASIACALADSIGFLIAARSVQGLGGALLLAGSLPVLGTLAGSTARGVAIWTLAGTFGAAVGPALGGVLTQIFDWRAIFVFQAPVAGAALLATFGAHVAAILREGWRPSLWRTVPGNVALALLSGALVGTLFLGVLLVIDVFGLTPIQGAAVVSAIPATALLARALAARLPAALAIASGAVLLAAGLIGLGFLPSSDLGYTLASFALCGLGLGLAVPGLSHAVLRGEGGIARNATLTVGVRHLGLVLALAIGAPLLAGDLLAGANEDPARSRYPRRARARAEGRDPGLRGLVRRGRCGDRRCRAAGARRLGRDDRTGRHQDLPTVVPVLRAARGARARADPRVPEAVGGVNRRMALGVLVALFVGAAGLITLEFANGAADAGALAIRDPCEPRSAFTGEGVDATLQRIVSDGLDGAACELGTTREELVLSLAPGSGVEAIPWDDETIELAVRAGLLESIDSAEQRGSLNALLAVALRQVVEHAPVQWLIDGGQGIAGLFD